MEEAAVGSVLGASIQILLQNLLSIPVEEINLFLDFKKDLEKLENSFLMIQDFLSDAKMQQVTNRAVKRWLKRLEAVAFEADDVLDELNYHVLRRKMETQNKMKKKVQDFFSHSNPIAFRRKMARKIRDINEKLKLINKEARDYGLQTSKPAGADAPDPLAGRETDSYSEDPIFVGRENDVSRIVEMLTSGPTEQVFSVLPLVGMGGLGKTTLARQVFHDEKIKTHFEKRIWVYVSRNFDAMNILKSMATENVELKTKEALLRKLQQDLGGQRCLLVLDDVWNEERESWDNLISSLTGISSVIGNGIIVTTRSEKVASIVRTLDIYELEGLTENNCWSMIKAKAIKEGEIPSEFETIGRKIAERCQGLPLAAKVVGSLLSNKSKDEWLSIEGTWLSNFGEDENSVLKILKLSFDHLSSPALKKCFACCSIFPKGFDMERQKLIELWMAEGFLEADQSNDMETVGNKYFNLLLQNSLLQVMEKDDFGNIKSCNMHDFVHDLASSVLGNKSIYVNDSSWHDINQVRYIRLKFDESLQIRKEQARCLRTLILDGKVSDGMSLDFRSLHVLILMDENLKELPSSIRELIHLRNLDISYTKIKCLPDSIGELYHLQTLRAVPYLQKLPNTLKYLISLRHLHTGCAELPPEIGTLASLQTLRFFEVGHGKGCRIGELGSLKNLKGKLEIFNLEKVDDKEEAKSAGLFQKPNILELRFAWYGPREGEINDKNVLEGLQSHPNLKSLEIDGFRGRSFPLWTLKMEVRDELEGRWVGLNNLTEIRLTRCKECEEIPMLGQLPNLKSLYLNGLSNVRSIGSSFYGIDNCSSCNELGKDTIILFPVLERLQLIDMPNLKEWVEVELPTAAETQRRELVVFPWLENLEIRNCRQLTSAPSHFPCLKGLKISGMDSALPLANICGGVNFNSLTELSINELDGLICLQDVLFRNNQNLSNLSIRNCPNLTHLVPSFGGGGASLRQLWIDNCSNLREVPDDLNSLNSLEKLCISRCPNLKSIPYPSSGGQSHEGFISLRTLEIRDCQVLTNLSIEMVESCAPVLEHLLLRNKLTNFPLVIRCLQKMPWLIELIIRGFSDSLNYKEIFDGVFQELKSLRRLQFYGLEHWESLPDGLQHLTALTHLELYDFGIEALPDWFGNLSSLQQICLIRCKKLSRPPSKQAMQRLTNLKEFYIHDCPLLKLSRIEQPNDNVDSEWPKIYYLPIWFSD